MNPNSVFVFISYASLVVGAVFAARAVAESFVDYTARVQDVRALRQNLLALEKEHLRIRRGLSKPKVSSVGSRVGDDGDIEPGGRTYEFSDLRDSVEQLAANG